MVIRQITKYPNNTYYDTMSQHKITLPEILNLYLNEPVIINTVKGTDITNRTLLRACYGLMEGNPDFYLDAVVAMIRFASKGIPLSEMEISNEV